MTDQRQILVYGDWTKDDPVLLERLGIGRQEMLQYEGCFALANA